MKLMILAGGLGTRLSEETTTRPKPMVEIGGQPVLWHIMKIYSTYGVNDFVICCGYKGYLIKEYFSNYILHRTDVSFDLKTGAMTVHSGDVEPWTVTLVETGDSTQTGGRIVRAASYIGDEEFAMTYGDAVADIDIEALVKFHHSQGRRATVTAVRPPARFGALQLEGSRVLRFQEKPVGEQAWINGGFFVLSPSVVEYIDSDSTLWEHEPMERLAKEGELSSYKHEGYWQPMDTLRDRNLLEEQWQSGKAPWKSW